MSARIRLSRGGAKKRPYYYVVVAHSASPRDGRYIEQIGTFDPMLPKDNPERVKLNLDRCKHWISVGAQPSDRVARFLDAAGVKERAARNNPKQGIPGEKAKERAEEKAQKLVDAEEAAKEAAEAAAAAAAAPAPEPEVEAPAEEAAAPEAAAEEAAAEEAPAAEEAAPEAAAEEAPATEAGEEKAEG